MPEGDSIAKAAARLRPYLVGSTVAKLRLRERGDVPVLTGAKVQGIETHGKHMMIRLQPDWVLRVHLGMHGRWRMQRPGQHERYARSQASVVLATETVTAICTRAMAAALRHADDPNLRQILRRLGPDLLSPQFDLDEIVHRVRTVARQDGPVAELLLDQRVAAGIGNVYKSEALFLVGVHPQTPVAEVSDEQLRSLYTVSRRMMRLNLVPGLRTTTAEAAVGIRRPPSMSRHWVYRRRGLTCFRCKELIVRALVGDQARSTYWCPKCQPGRAVGA